MDGGGGEDRLKKSLRTTGLAVLAAAAAAALAALVVRDQLSRHQRDLFASSSLRRLAALGYMARAEATVDNINLLRDFIAWEPRPLLRRRATSVVRRMEEEAGSRVVATESTGAS